MQQSKILLKLRKIIIKDLKQPILYRVLIKAILLNNCLNLKTIEDIHKYLNSEEHISFVRYYRWQLKSSSYTDSQVEMLIIVNRFALVGNWNQDIEYNQDLIKLNILLERFFDKI